jgi:glutamyl-tRNA synthetase
MDLLRQFSAELQSGTSLTTAEFRTIAGALKDATKRKGKQLFHPIRAALTMKSSGPELDKLIPMIEFAAQLKLHDVASCRDRAKAFLERYG